MMISALVRNHRLRETLSSQGPVIVGRNGQQAIAHIESEVARRGKAVKAAAIRAQ
jgi:hypothetical protein